LASSRAADNISAFDATAYANERSRQEGFSTCYDTAACNGTIGVDYDCEKFFLTADTPYECSGYRLPTEAQWEYAARAGTTTAFYSGDIREADVLGECIEDPAMTAIGWYCWNSDNRTHAVAQKIANGWGLYDVSGNAAEWCNDLFDGLGYGEGPLTNPTGTLITSRDITPPVQNARIQEWEDSSKDHDSCKSNTRCCASSAGADVGTGLRPARTKVD